MTKFEIEKGELDIQFRSLQEKVKAGSVDSESARKSFDELRAKKTEIEKAEAAASISMTTRANSFDEMRSAIQEKRAITMEGNGVINQVSEIVKLIRAKTPILERIGYIYGKNAQTNIPLLDPGLAIPGTVVEGFTSGHEDSTAALKSKAITPISWTSTLPVSWESLNLLSANLEGELPALFAEVFATAMNTLVMGHLFHADGVAAANKVSVTDSGEFASITDLVKLSFALQDKNYLAPVMVMNSQVAVYAMSSATDTVGKLYAEEIARSRTVNGIPLIFTGSAPVAKTTGSALVVAGDLSGYKCGVASELMIEPKKKVGDGQTYFDALMFFNGAVVQNKNFMSLVGK